MDSLLAILGVLLVVALGLTFLAVPHLLEGVVHLFTPSLAGTLATLPLTSRDLRESATPPPTKAVPDGYRSTKQVEVERPGFEPGVWVVGPAEAPHSRIHVVSPRVAYVSILPPSSGWLAFIPRAIATVRVHTVDGAGGRRLEARVLPACLTAPLAIPTSALALALNDHTDPMRTLPTALAVGAVVFAVFVPVWWARRGDVVMTRAQNAMEVLENQLVAAARATT